ERLHGRRRALGRAGGARSPRGLTQSRPSPAGRRRASAGQTRAGPNPSQRPSMRLCRPLAALLLVALAVPALAAARPLRQRTWLSGSTVTEYWPAPEKWFRGKKVRAPGLKGLHRIDWLYSAQGLSMEGDGIGLDGKRYHIEDLGSGGWVDATGSSHGPPFWR